VRRPRSPAALAIRTDPRDVVEERLDDPPLFLDRFLIGEEDAIADERRVEELFVPVPAAWSVTTIAFIVRLPVSSSCLLTDRSRPRRRLTDANEHASPSPSATAHERTEYLRSQAGATGGNQWQMGAPENRSNKPIRNPWQPTATGSQRMVRRGSTVRVRQRALQKRRTSALFRAARLALRRACGGYGTVYGAFAHARPVVSGEPGRVCAPTGAAASHSVRVGDAGRRAPVPAKQDEAGEERPEQEE
jgi:hypothetical protein